jgi:RimJ/RimL family protein N-acetyltransferase
VPQLVEPILPAGTFAGRAQPRIPGAGVTLRPWRDRDVPALVAAYADPAIQLWHCTTLTEWEATALVLRWADAWDTDSGASWAVEDSDGVLLGRAGFRVARLGEGAAEVAYWVLPSARRRGVAKAAVTTLARWSFEEIGFNRLELLHSVRNEPSCGVARSTGFTLEGTLRSSLMHVDGWHDMHLHARLRSDPG